MKNVSRLLAIFCFFYCFILIATHCDNPEKKSTPTVEVESPIPESTFVPGAFQNHRTEVPSKQEYDGPLFELSHDYPTTYTPVVDPPWQKALKGKPISSANVFAYMDALKKVVAPNVIPFFTKNKEWTPAKHGWYNAPWLGSQREAIQGTFFGNGNQANMFKTLKVDEQGYALVLYDKTAAYTVGQIWGETAQKVNLVNDAAQFPEGSVIVKLAFSNINGDQWPPMKGAQTVSIYDTIPTKGNPNTGYQVRDVSFFQMDVVVKDSKTAPKTGWVYSTFVYDKDVRGAFWEQMVPLGAMWGNDPDVISPVQPPYPALTETVINPNAPYYSTETLGWGGRLSGPNDGAVALNVTDVTGKKYDRLPLSSCMSCHLTAQDEFKAFLLPAETKTGFQPYQPGSEIWMRWFRDNYGTVPFTPGEVGMDYGLGMAFKAIPAYNKAHPTIEENLTLRNHIESIELFRRPHTKSLFWH